MLIHCGLGAPYVASDNSVDIVSGNCFNYANPVYGVPTICHQVRCLRRRHPSLFHTATSFFYIKCSAWEIYHADVYGWTLLSVYAQSGRHRRYKLMNYCGFNIEPFCSDVCGDHRRPQTLAEICRNMGICCGFRAMAVLGKYPGFILLFVACSAPRYYLNQCWRTVKSTGTV